MDKVLARIRRLPSDTLTALGFFSRLPVKQSTGSFSLETVAGAWPLTGLILAVAPALVLLLAHATGFPAFVAAILALALMAALTGAMHEDGLADTFDGLGGGRTPEEKRAIMRDSRLGSYGALALVFTIFAKVAALAALGVRPGHAALALFCAAIVSRALALWHWHETPPARTEGVAHAAGCPDRAAFLLGLTTGAVALAALLVAFGMAALIGALMAAVAVGLLSATTHRQIGGHTGDTIGAAQQLAETLLIAGLAIASPSIAA